MVVIEGVSCRPEPVVVKVGAIVEAGGITDEEGDVCLGVSALCKSSSFAPVSFAGSVIVEGATSRDISSAAASLPVTEGAFAAAGVGPFNGVGGKWGVGGLTGVGSFTAGWKPREVGAEKGIGGATGVVIMGAARTGRGAGDGSPAG
jgi:hypothetical protein